MVEKLGTCSLGAKEHGDASEHLAAAVFQATEESSLNGASQPARDGTMLTNHGRMGK